MIYGVRRWAVVVGLLTIAAAGVGSFLALRTPGPPEPCRDSMDVGFNPDLECTPGARVEIYPAGHAGGHPLILVKCVCPRAKP